MSRPMRVYLITMTFATLCVPWRIEAQAAPASAASTAAPGHAMHGQGSSRPAHDMPMPMHAGHADGAVAPAATGMDMPPSSGGHAMPSPHAMAMGSMQGGGPPPGARDPDYSDGISFPRAHDAHMHGDSRYGMVAIDRLEFVHGADGGSGALEGQAWYGGDLDKATLKFEGDASGGRVADARVEALWSHAVSAYWDTQLGMRHDGGEGPSRDWAAFGVQGLAPYWFDVQATFYAGASGRTAARLEVEYEVLFTQRLILTPKFELNAYGKDDRGRGIGRGLSDAGLGLRLRYEVRRRVAPYIGLDWTRRFGATAGLARQRMQRVSSAAWVAGVRVWW